MSMDLKGKISFHEEQIRKLRQLEDLLRDPDIAATATDLLLQQSSTPVRGSRHPHMRKRGRKRNLKNRALEIVKRSTQEMSARDVVAELEKEGFAFRAKNRMVAVSKVLRSLAGEREIVSIPGAQPKAAIRYSALPSLLTLPVQETTQ